MAATKTTTPKKTSTRKKAAPRAKAPDVSDLMLPKFVADDYINREYRGGHSDFDALQDAMEAGHNVLLYGPTGPGKTSLAMAFAAANNLPFDSIPCHGAIEDKAFFGSVMPNESATGGGWVWQDGPITRLVRNKKGGVLLLDEVNFLHPRIGAVLHPLLDKRRHVKLLGHQGETVNAGDNLLIIAAFNPDYEGTRPLNPAFRNRFRTQLFMDYDEEIEGELLSHSTLQVLAAKLRSRHEAGDLRTPISTNMLMEFEDIAESMSFDFSVQNFIWRFSVAEQPVISEVMEMYMDRLEADFGVQTMRDDSQVDGDLSGAINP